MQGESIESTEFVVYLFNFLLGADWKDRVSGFIRSKHFIKVGNIKKIL